eukprot:3777318-Rhodomonas_salina.3
MAVPDTQHRDSAVCGRIYMVLRERIPGPDSQRISSTCLRNRAESPDRASEDKGQAPLPGTGCTSEMVFWV